MKSSQAYLFQPHRHILEVYLLISNPHSFLMKTSPVSPLKTSSPRRSQSCPFRKRAVELSPHIPVISHIHHSPRIRACNTPLMKPEMHLQPPIIRSPSTTSPPFSSPYFHERLATNVLYAPATTKLLNQQHQQHSPTELLPPSPPGCLDPTRRSFRTVAYTSFLNSNFAPEHGNGQRRRGMA